MAADSNDPSSPAVNFVNVQRMTTDPEFCERALQLLEAVKENQLAEYCQIKLRESEIEIEKQLWEFMMVCLINCYGTAITHVCIKVFF